MFKKLVVVHGDLGVDGLGIADPIRQAMEEDVSVVFHGAATLKLEANLKDAVEMNLTGTWRVIQLCKKMKKLEVSYSQPSFPVLSVPIW